MNSLRTSTSVLRETLDRLNETTGGQLRARVGVPDEPGWVRGDAILETPEQYVPDLLETMADSLGARGRKVVASFFLKAWLRQVVLAGAGSFLLQRRVPDVSIGNLAFRFGEDGRVDEIAFLKDRTLVLEDDFASGAPDVRAFVTVDDLRAGLRDTLAWEHVGPLIEALRPFVPVGDRFMWATTADTCAGFILLLGKRLALDIDYGAEADRLVGMEPLKGKTGSLAVEHDGRRTLALERGCCCFAYHLDQYEHCKTCPLLPRKTRIENIRAEMAAGRE